MTVEKKGTLRDAIRSSFEEESLTHARRASLRAQLLVFEDDTVASAPPLEAQLDSDAATAFRGETDAEFPRGDAAPFFPPVAIAHLDHRVSARSLGPWLRRHTGVLAAWTVAAAAVLFAVRHPTAEEDGIGDLVGETRPLHLARSLPSDFDLEGEPGRLMPIVQEVLGGSEPSFRPEVPLHVLDAFEPGAGRFFTWHGAPAIAVSLTPREAIAAAGDEDEDTVEGEETPHGTPGMAVPVSMGGATLYMIHAPDSRSRISRLAHDETPRQVKLEGLTAKPVHVWRKQGVTYLLVPQEDQAAAPR